MAGSEHPRKRHRLLTLLAAGAILYGLGFAWFVLTLPQPGPEKMAKADGIVALTGDGDRLVPAVNLLQNGHGKRLLITGVNRLISKSRLKSLLHAGAVFDCCADLGFAAEDTRGNATEAARWARSHGYGSLIVVTADYHMPRSLLEFGAEMPGIKLLPYPVSEAPKKASWQNLKRLSGEYAKYLASMVRVSLLNLGAVRNA